MHKEQVDIIYLIDVDRTSLSMRQFIYLGFQNFFFMAFFFPPTNVTISKVLSNLFSPSIMRTSLNTASSPSSTKTFLFLATLLIILP